MEEEQFNSMFNKEGRPTNQDLENIDEKSGVAQKTNRGGFNSRGRGSKKVQDLRKVQCYNCEKWGHYVADYWHEKGKYKRDSNLEAIVAQEESEEPVVLMATS